MDDAVAEEAALTSRGAMAEGAQAPSEPQAGEGLRAFLRRHATPRVATTIAVWRVLAWFDTPLALLLVATLGRWPGALAMGSLMGAMSGLFLLLMDGEPVVRGVRSWLERRRLARRYLSALDSQRGLKLALTRGLGILYVVLFMGAFLRALSMHLLRVSRAPAYLIAVGSSIPHSLLWTGLVLGGVWEGLVWPFLDKRWF